MGYLYCSEVNQKDWFRVLAYSWHFLVSFKENQFVGRGSKQTWLLLYTLSCLLCKGHKSSSISLS